MEVAGIWKELKKFLVTPLEGLQRSGDYMDKRTRSDPYSSTRGTIVFDRDSLSLFPGSMSLTSLRKHQSIVRSPSLCHTDYGYLKSIYYKYELQKTESVCGVLRRNWIRVRSLMLRISVAVCDARSILWSRVCFNHFMQSNVNSFVEGKKKRQELLVSPTG